MESTTAEKPTERGRQESLALYRANAKGTGAALRIEPRTNQKPGDRYNCFFLEMASQKPPPDAAGKPGERPGFDWRNKITVKLSFADLCEFLAVLEGAVPRVGGKHDGLYHRTGNAGTLIRFGRHESGGYAIGLSRKRADRDEVQTVRMILSAAEGIGLRHVLGVGLFFIAVGGNAPGAA